MTAPIHIAGQHPAMLDLDLLRRDCRMGKGRSSGPGGQHRNKVETLVIYEHLPTGIEARAGERRSAEENRQVALRRLRLRLAVEVRAAVPLGEVRSALWLKRCDRRGRVACNPEHEDYPAMLAEAMDVVWACGLDLRKASLRLCCTASQLLKLIKDHPPAITLLNAARVAAGEHPLK